MASAVSSSVGTRAGTSGSTARAALAERCYPRRAEPAEAGFQAEDLIAEIAVAPDGCRVAVASRFSELLLFDSNTARLIGRVDRGPAERSISAAFIDQHDLVFCNTDRSLYRYRGRSEPVPLTTLWDASEGVDDQQLAVDRAAQRIAVMGSNFGAQKLRLRVVGFDGKLVASRTLTTLNRQPGAGDVYGEAVLHHDVFSVFVHGMERRYFVRTDDASEPETRWPTGMAFEGLGSGPETATSGPAGVVALTDQHTGHQRSLPRERGIPRAATWSRDGKRLWVSYERAARGCAGMALLDPQTLAERAFVPGPCVYTSRLAVWAQNDALLVVAFSSAAYFIDAAKGTLLGTLQLASRKP